MAGVYIHIPFCARRCGYCDFFSSTERGLMPAVLSRIEEEIVRERGWLRGEPVHTVYFGGGTPSLVEPERLQRIIDTIKRRHCEDASRGITERNPEKEHWNTGLLRRVAPRNDAATQECLSEITMEANPDDLTPDYLEKLTKTDINRLSIGIQSFIDRDLRLMGRRHDAQRAVQAVRDAQKEGFKNITIDLIFGIPGMTLDEWRENLQQALALNVQHISAYHLTLEQGTPMGGMKPIDETASEAQFAMLHETLTQAGYEHYEVSNFAKIRALHNANYWNGTPYLGVGAGAHSFDGFSRRHFKGNLHDYAEGRIEYETETLTETDRYNELIMTRLRTAEGIADNLIAPPQRLLQGGLLVRGNGFYRIPSEKFLLSDMVISSLFE